MKRGIVFATLAYALWGVFPIYFRALTEVAPYQLLLNRMVWALLFLVVVLALRRQWLWLPRILADRAQLVRFTASALVLSCNWGVYIWACNSGRIVDASLGYFINPLVNVVLAALVLRERLRAAQWLAVAIAAGGVIWLAFIAGHPPIIGLILAFSFSSYGLLRKTARLGALEGLALETILLFPFALACLAWLTWQGNNQFLSASPVTRWLLVCAGPITAVPLLLFAVAARSIPFALLGILQFLSPSIQLFLGVWLYGEAFAGARLAGFCAIWLALLIYSAEGWRSSRSARKLAD